MTCVVNSSVFHVLSFIKIGGGAEPPPLKYWGGGGALFILIGRDIVSCSVIIVCFNVHPEYVSLRVSFASPDLVAHAILLFLLL